MGRPYDTVSFLSDYGRADEFVGVVHSVLRTMAAHATVIDITHDVAPHDIRAGSLLLARAVQYLAPGVILAVVDPGVGTERRAIAVEVAGGEGVFVGPDNGLLAPAVAMTGGAVRAVSLSNATFHLDGPSPTFAGRDLFAPVVAHLCNGTDLAELGETIDPHGLRPGIIPLNQPEGSKIKAEVLWVDRFGNIQLNVGPEELDSLGERVTVRWGDQVRTARRATTYGDLKGGELGLVVDSYGLVSITLDRHHAASELGINESDGVSLEPALL
ncbi:MAG TPA: SAM-dependent chlorinase/fluorinase [Acidimicrobiales bacterium]|nr:SAM-dependent chlorinase/fluorinase [Acidimicrobiales bacterium]